MRLTKIICTIGPAARDPESLRELVKNGMNIARINLSHGTAKEQEATIDELMKINGEGHNIGIMLDTRGAEIRTGDVIDPIKVTKGEEYVFSSVAIPGEKRTIIEVNYSDFEKDVRETKKILIDNGELTFDILSIEPNGSVIGKANQSGSIGTRRHINLPGADIDLPALTERDWEDIEYGIERNLDFVALSFIRTAEEVEEARKFIEKRKGTMRIITKIETQKAVDNIAEIIDVSDAIMVARGDLGAELPFELLPAIQDEIVSRCQERGVPVIIATHMLESMCFHPMPTRAEVTDVAHAAATGADCTMLSGETAGGKFPQESVQAMDRILQATEKHLARFWKDFMVGVHTEREAQGEAAVTLSMSSKADAIVLFTRTGETAKHISKYRPRIPIIAVCDSAELAQRLQIYYGVYPLVIKFSDTDATIDLALTEAKKSGFLKKGNKIVLVSDAQAKDEKIPSLQLREVA